jgi:hypothetical protein
LDILFQMLSPFPISLWQKRPITSPLLLLLWGYTPPTHPLPLPCLHTPLQWNIKPSLDQGPLLPLMSPLEGHPLLHIQLKPCVSPCVLLGWWWRPWQLWLVDIVVLPMGLQISSAPSVLSLTPPLGSPCSVQWLASSMHLCICQALAKPLWRQLYQALVSKIIILNSGIYGTEIIEMRQSQIFWTRQAKLPHWKGYWTTQRQRHSARRCFLSWIQHSNSDFAG